MEREGLDSSYIVIETRGEEKEETGQKETAKTAQIETAQKARNEQMDRVEQNEQEIKTAQNKQEAYLAQSVQTVRNERVEKKKSQLRQNERMDRIEQEVYLAQSVQNEQMDQPSQLRQVEETEQQKIVQTVQNRQNDYLRRVSRLDEVVSRMDELSKKVTEQEETELTEQSNSELTVQSDLDELDELAGFDELRNTPSDGLSRVHSFDDSFVCGGLSGFVKGRLNEKGKLSLSGVEERKKEKKVKKEKEKNQPVKNGLSTGSVKDGLDDLSAGLSVSAELVEDRFINILTPQKDKKDGMKVFLTPVKRSRRSVINGLKLGRIKVCDNSVEIRSEDKEYVSLVETFRKIGERKVKKRKKEGIDEIVERYTK